MPVDSISKLGGIIGGLSADQRTTQESLQEDDSGAVFNIVQSDFVRLSGVLTVTAKYLPTDSFVLDHPVYGELDSPVLKLDGGYAETTGGTIEFPATFPWTFAGGTSGTEVLYTTNF